MRNILQEAYQHVERQTTPQTIKPRFSGRKVNEGGHVRPLRLAGCLV